MSLVRMSPKTRLELEKRVLTAALELSLQSGDLAGTRCAYERLNRFIKDRKPEKASWQESASLFETEILPSSSPSLAFNQKLVDRESGETGFSEMLTPPPISEVVAHQVSNHESSKFDGVNKAIIKTPLKTTASKVPVLRTINPQILKENSSSQLLKNVSSNIVRDSSSNQTSGLYEILYVSQMSPYEEIHKNFLIIIRSLIRVINVTKRPEKVDLLHKLRKVWIAHDILTDPVTRTDYDFRHIGLRGDSDSSLPATPEDKLQAQETNRTPTRIGELLQCAGLLEPTELQIACDMHKAMPEVLFGKFLVQQGFIVDRDLESVLLGQKLLRAKILSVAQFQSAMELSQSRNEPLKDTLVQLGYAKDEDVNEIMNSDLAPPVVVSPVEPIAPVRIAKSSETQDKLPRQALPPGNIVDLIDFEPLVIETQPIKNSVDVPAESSTELSIKSGVELPNIHKKPLPPTNPSLDDGAVVPRSRALIISQAVPVWQDQLDWDAPDEKMASNHPNSLPEEREKISYEIPSQESHPQINLNRALPSWQDQLDWAAPESEAVPDPSQQDAPHVIEDELSRTPKQRTSENSEEQEEDIDDQSAYNQLNSEPDATEEEEWFETPADRQRETATQLQSLKIENTILKPGSSFKKNKDKKKGKSLGNP